MGTITGQEIIARAQQELFDINGIQWNPTELLGWLNDGQRQITMMTPESTSLTRATMNLVAGTEQNIPADGWMLIDVYRNMGVGGATPGRRVRLINRKLLDAFDSSWDTDTPVTNVTNWLFDPQSVTMFWVYPPSDGTGSVEINYSQVPADIGAASDAITINDIFETALIDYILYRACSKQVSYAPGPEKAANYWASFERSLISKSKAEIVNDPNQDLGHPPPDEAGVQR